MRFVPLRRQAFTIAAVLALAAAGAAAPAAASALTATRTASSPASAPSFHPVRRPALPAGERYVCPAPTRPAQMECMSIVTTVPAGVRPAATPAVSNYFYGPSDLRSAYKIKTPATRNGRGEVVAVVDAYSDPRAAADLAVYRSHYKLGACTERSGCLRIVNQYGNTRNLPAADRHWAMEESLDLDMVSAICPLCRILLVEARTSFTFDLGTAEDTAVHMGARYVSNSWSGSEFSGQDASDHFFNHPGVAVAFASGDTGYGTAYPADLQYVTSVGGTSLWHARNARGWTESVWGTSTNSSQGTGSGCSPYEAKPSWQRADDSSSGCLTRTENDVAAVANPNTGVASYDTYRSGGSWLLVGGTSAATPIVAAIYALAGKPEAGTYPAEYPYLHTRDFFDVPTGVNGSCGSRAYLCHGGTGYNGPTGLGTPNYITGLSESAHLVTVLDPGAQMGGAGASFSLRIAGLDSWHVSSLRWTATGLPGTLTIHSVPNSTYGEISGTLPTTAGTYDVTVTGADSSASGSTHFTIVVS